MDAFFNLVPACMPRDNAFVLLVRRGPLTMHGDDDADADDGWNEIGTELERGRRGEMEGGGSWDVDHSGGSSAGAGRK